jgi:hypothetical protein
MRATPSRAAQHDCPRQAHVAKKIQPSAEAPSTSIRPPAVRKENAMIYRLDPRPPEQLGFLTGFIDDDDSALRASN